MVYDKAKIKKPLGKVNIIYEDSKLRVTTEASPDKETGKPNLVFRIEVRYFNQCLHANIAPANALALSDAIYNAFPEALLDEIATQTKEQESTETN